LGKAGEMYCINLACASFSPCEKHEQKGSSDKVDVGDGVLLPIEKHVGQAGKMVVLMGHGLGSSQTTDRLVGMVCEAALSVSLGAVSYDARGHGASMGWQHNAANLAQFSWSALANDQRMIAKHLGLSQWIAAGNSMGAATALWAAVRFPDQVRALILVRPPTCWETRVARKQSLVANAEKLRKGGGEAPPMYHVLLGAAEADFPSAEQIKTIACPTLIVAAEGDPVHPVATASMLERSVRFAKLVVTKDVEPDVWLAVIAKFLSSLSL